MKNHVIVSGRILIAPPKFSHPVRCETVMCIISIIHLVSPQARLYIFSLLFADRKAMGIFMSGLSGIISFKKNLYAYKSYNRLVVRDMASALSNRGSDRADEWVGEHAAFSNNSFLITEHVSGNQPMKRTVEGYEFVITYDGELYNSEELRNDLGCRGYIFETKSDTEVLLYCYIHYGESCCEKLNGIYAFAIWDSMRQQVFICRDRFGAKPFFYTKCDDTVIFASEIKALFRYPCLKPCIGKNGLCEIFGISPFKTPGAGVFKDVHELKPGHFMIINRSAITTKKYWDFSNIEHSDSFEETGERIKELLSNSVKDRLSSDTAVILSDNIGSDMIAAICPSETSTESLFISSFDADTHLKFLCDAVNFTDLPLLSDCDISLLYFYSQLKKKHNTVLTCTGCDEIFCITPQYNSSVFPQLNMRESVLKPAVRETLDLNGFTHMRYEEFQSDAYPNSECINLFLPSILSRTDALSTASGVSIRTPFCDHKLVEYVLNIPAKMRDDILAETAKGILSSDVMCKKKSPHPKTHNSDYDKGVYELLLNIINDYSSPILAFVDRASVLKVCPSQSVYKMMGFIEYLIQINYWLKKFNPRII